MVANKGELDVDVRARGPDSAKAWYTLALPSGTLRAQESQALRLDIRPNNPVFFFLCRVWKLFVRKEATAALSFHIPEKEPYDLTKYFQVSVHFSNPWPVVLLLQFVVCVIIILKVIIWNHIQCSD